MAFIRNLFKKASEITRLNQEIDFIIRQKNEIEGLLNREESRNALLEKSLKSERTAKDKILLRYADQVSRQVKLPEHFVSDAAPKVEVKPEVLNTEQEQKLNWLANEQRDWDIAEKGEENVPPLEVYINAIKADDKKLADALQL